MVLSFLIVARTPFGTAEQYKTKKIQSNLGFRTSRSSNNLVFELKIRDENDSVVEQKFGSQTQKRTTATHAAKTKRKHFPVDRHTRYSTFVVTLCICNFIALNTLFSSLALSQGCEESEK